MITTARTGYISTSAFEPLIITILLVLALFALLTSFSNLSASSSVNSFPIYLIQPSSIRIKVIVYI